MTDRFEVPNWTVGLVPDGTQESGNRQVEVVLMVDVPGIVRAEVSHLHGFLARVMGVHGHRVVTTLDDEMARYRDARFGEAGDRMGVAAICDKCGATNGMFCKCPEAAPEQLRTMDCGMCHRSECRQCYPAPTERRESKGPRSICGRASGGSGASMTVQICAHSPGHQGPCSWEASHATISPAERDFLHALASQVRRQRNLFGMGDEDVVAAARRVVEAE